MTDKKYAKVVWTAHDVKTLRPNWTLDKCNEFLAYNEETLQDRTIEYGWEVMGHLISMMIEKEHYWIICNQDKPSLAWSNSYGWVNDDSYDLFSDEEKRVLNLPMGGYWHDPEYNQ